MRGVKKDDDKITEFKNGRQENSTTNIGEVDDSDGVMPL